MGYLLPTEYVQYGLTAETTDDWVTAASALIEAYCRRSSLMVTQYVERIRITAGAQAVRLSYRPLVAVESVRVRYGKPRRGEVQDLFREQVAWAFGLPGSWSSLDLGSIDVNMTNGEVTFLANLLGLNYNEAEITYTAGFVTAPVSIKVACTQVVKNMQVTPAANVRSSRLDALQMEYFSGVLIDAQVQSLLQPFVAERLGEAMADSLSATGSAVRTADALLRGTGGRMVLLRLPAPAIPADPTEQLGLAVPEFQDVELAPVVIYGQGADGARTLLVSASAVRRIIGSLGYSAASVLFAGAYGVLVDEVLMEIASATEAEANGAPYMYRLGLKMPIALAI